MHFGWSAAVIDIKCGIDNIKLTKNTFQFEGEFNVTVLTLLDFFNTYQTLMHELIGNAFLSTMYMYMMYLQYCTAN